MRDNLKEKRSALLCARVRAASIERIANEARELADAAFEKVVILQREVEQLEQVKSKRRMA